MLIRKGRRWLRFPELSRTGTIHCAGHPTLLVLQYTYIHCASHYFACSAVHSNLRLEHTTRQVTFSSI